MAKPLLKAGVNKQMNKKAIILVAGMGTRLKPLTLETHKCLTLIHGCPILLNALECLLDIGVKEVVLVVGYLADEIIAQVGFNYKGMGIRYVRNTKYSKTNTSYSLKLGLQQICDYETLYILEGDVFFENKLIKMLESNQRENITLVEKYRPSLDGTFVSLDKNSYVTDWTHKSMRENSYHIEDKFKTINIHKFNKKFIDTLFLQTLKDVCEETQGKAPFENVMRLIVRNNEHLIYGLECGNAKWCEVDDLNDLKMAENIFDGENK